MSEEDQAQPGQQQGGDQQFQVQKIYLKDASFETPNAPGIFTHDWDPKINVELNTRAERVDEGVYESVVTVTVTAKLEETTAYLCEVQQAGVFTIQGVEGERLNALLGGYCPQILFPYAREAVSELVAKGGFPQMLLAPVNFDALYAQQRAQQQQQQQQGATH